MSPKKPRRRAAPALSARTADRYQLYHDSVQCPEAEIAFLQRVYRRHNGTLPRILREDFCGTGWLACEWARVRPENRAIGVDLDPVPLAWGEEHCRRPLGAAASRVQLVQGDVRGTGGPRPDITLALNFSYYCFQKRAELLDYFRSARRRLRPGGLLIIDAFGGTGAMEPLEESTRKKGFTYVWDQDEFDPLSHEIKCYIHFRFPDGSEMKRAFSYDWRLWTLPELRDCLADAGYRSVDVYLETVGKDGWGTGSYRRVTRTESCEGLVGYLVAER